MTLPTVRQLLLFCLFWCLGCWSMTGCKSPEYTSLQQGENLNQNKIFKVEIKGISSTVNQQINASLLDQWEEGIALRKIRDIQNDDLSDVLLRDENENQVQNVFKRFLFHYSKALNSVGAVQHQANSVHPLMRLSPKLSQRRKKKVLLLKIRALPEGML